MTDRASLLILPNGSDRNAPAIQEIARRNGLDPHSLRMMLSGCALASAGRGPADRLGPAAVELSQAGLRAVLVGDAELQELPALQLAGGISGDGDRLSLLVHGRPFGPPAGEPLLFVFADLGREGHSLPPTVDTARGSVRQRLLRAILPVVDVVWRTGRVRVAVRTMTWRGLPEHTLAAADNMLRALGTIAHDAGGTVVDFGFCGQDLGLDPRGAVEPIEGADGERSHLFDRYAAAATLAWQQGLYPSAQAGEVVALAGGAVAPEGVREARAFFSAVAPRPPAPTIPWVRGGKRSRVRWSLWPWLVGPPAAAYWLMLKSQGAAGVGLSGVAFMAGGLGSIVLGLRALKQREQIRSVPLSRIRSMPMGPVEVAGKAVPIAPFKAPYSHAECVWYRFEVRQLISEETPAGAFSRALFAGDCGDTPFLLQDGSASVLVQPAGAEVDGESNSFPGEGGSLVVEWIVPIGAWIFVSGFAQRRSTDASSPPPALPQGKDDIFVGSSPDVPLHIVLRSRSAEVEELSRRFTWPVVAGAAYLLVALLLWLAL